MIHIDYIGLGFSMALILAFVAPFVYQARKNYRNKKQMMEGFYQHFGIENPSLVQTQVWRNSYILGWEVGSARLLYWNAFTAEYVAVNLWEISDINIHQMAHMVKKEHIIDKIQLVIHRKAGQPDLFLEIYDGERFSDLQGEYPMAKHWQNVLMDAKAALAPLPAA